MRRNRPTTLVPLGLVAPDYRILQYVFTLNEEEKRKLREEIQQLPQEKGAEILNIMNSYEKKGYERGREEEFE